MRVIFLFICFIVLVSCSENKLVKDFENQQIPESAAGLDEFKIVAEEDNENVITQKNANAKLVYADNLIKLGNYELAIRTFLEIYEDDKYRDNQRDDALYRLGKLYESVLYDGADINEAIRYYQLLIEEFPLSNRRLDAFQRRELLKLQLEEREIYKQNNTTE